MCKTNLKKITLMDTVQKCQDELSSIDSRNDKKKIFNLFTFLYTIIFLNHFSWRASRTLTLNCGDNVTLHGWETRSSVSQISSDVRTSRVTVHWWDKSSSKECSHQVRWNVYMYPRHHTQQMVNLPRSWAVLKKRPLRYKFFYFKKAKAKSIE